MSPILRRCRKCTQQFGAPGQELYKLLVKAGAAVPLVPGVARLTAKPSWNSKVYVESSRLTGYACNYLQCQPGASMKQGIPIQPPTCFLPGEHHLDAWQNPAISRTARRGIITLLDSSTPPTSKGAGRGRAKVPGVRKLGPRKRDNPKRTTGQPRSNPSGGRRRETARSNRDRLYHLLQIQRPHRTYHAVVHPPKRTRPHRWRSILHYPLAAPQPVVAKPAR
jgi:hypothetical protein